MSRNEATDMPLRRDPYMRDKEVSSIENMLAAACSGFGTEIGQEVEGPSMWIGRGVSVRVEDKGNLL
jgi:hypothetical protein